MNLSLPPASVDEAYGGKTLLGKAFGTIARSPEMIEFTNEFIKINGLSKKIKSEIAAGNNDPELVAKLADLEFKLNALKEEGLKAGFLGKSNETN